jgi:Uma2 family endonuclease
MALAVTKSADDASGALLRPRLFTINDVLAMFRAGILRDDEHVELIEGQIVEMHAQGTRHVWAVSRLMITFARRSDVLVTAQSTFELHPRGGPEPDVVVLRADASQRRRPSAPDTVLVIEVSDTSLAYDREVKAPLYARAGVPEYWIVDLKGGRIEVYSEPSEAGYRARRLVLRGESLSPAFASDLIIEVDTILGPADAGYDDESAESA